MEFCVRGELLTVGGGWLQPNQWCCIKLFWYSNFFPVTASILKIRVHD